jgi:hypothetical protein
VLPPWRVCTVDVGVRLDLANHKKGAGSSRKMCAGEEEDGADLDQERAFPHTLSATDLPPIMTDASMKEASLCASSLTSKRCENGNVNNNLCA